MNNPNIVQIFNSFFNYSESELVIVMEYCSGISLFCYLLGGNLKTVIENYKKQKKNIPEENIIKWLVQMILGLSYIHSNGILHRDLKPANILLDSEENLKIADFGILKKKQHYT